MEQNINQESGQEEQKKTFCNKFPFIHYLKGRLVDYVDPVSRKRWTGHVAMFYKDTERIRIDWDNGATTYHDFSVDSKWIFSVIKKKKEGDG